MACFRQSRPSRCAGASRALTGSNTRALARDKRQFKRVKLAEGYCEAGQLEAFGLVPQTCHQALQVQRAAKMIPDKNVGIVAIAATLIKTSAAWRARLLELVPLFDFGVCQPSETLTTPNSVLYPLEESLIRRWHGPIVPHLRYDRKGLFITI
jgi:hypothetical protein